MQEFRCVTCDFCKPGLGQRHRKRPLTAILSRNCQPGLPFNPLRGPVPAARLLQLVMQSTLKVAPGRRWLRQFQGGPWQAATGRRQEERRILPCHGSRCDFVRAVLLPGFLGFQMEGEGFSCSQSQAGPSFEWHCCLVANCFTPMIPAERRRDPKSPQMKCPHRWADVEHLTTLLLPSSNESSP